jgi:hypothetical protein
MIAEALANFHCIKPKTIRSNVVTNVTVINGIYFDFIKEK